MTNENSNINDNGLTGEKLVSAVVSFLVLLFVYFPFVFPVVLWKKSTLSLASLHEKGGIFKTIAANDFPFFTWYRFAMDALIFISFIAGPVLIVIWSMNHELNGIISSIVFFWFMPVMLTLLKEIFGYFAYHANRSKEISDNTKRNS